MALIRLAGGILWREGRDGLRLAVIHRPRQGDWSLPKGRIDEGESWEEAALREVEEETACQARIGSFAGAAIYVPRRVGRLVLYWNMALQQEGDFQPGKEVDELVWLAPADALGRLDHDGERRVLLRASSFAARPTELARAQVPPDFAAGRAEIFRRLLAAAEEDEAAGLGPALDLLQWAEDAYARGDAREGSALVAEARRMALLSLREPELSLRARALREEARALSPWRKRAIRKLLPADEAPEPEAVFLAAELRDGERERRTWLPPLLGAGALIGLIVCLLRMPRTSVDGAVWAALCGALAGAAIAALFSWRSRRE